MRPNSLTRSITRDLSHESDASLSTYAIRPLANSPHRARHGRHDLFRRARCFQPRCRSCRCWSGLGSATRLSRIIVPAAEPNTSSGFARWEFDISPDAISTSAQATVHYLHSHLPAVKRLFVLGTDGLCDDLQSGGYEIVDDRPDAVVVGFDQRTDLRSAGANRLLDRPAIAVHRHASGSRLPDRSSRSCCPIAVRSAHCWNRPPAGGPTPCQANRAPPCCTAIVERHGLRADEIAMVGDRLYTDIRMARDAGALAILTLTGETRCWRRRQSAASRATGYCRGGSG